MSADGALACESASSGKVNGAEGTNPCPSCLHSGPRHGTQDTLAGSAEGDDNAKPEGCGNDCQECASMYWRNATKNWKRFPPSCRILLPAVSAARRKAMMSKAWGAECRACPASWTKKWWRSSTYAWYCKPKGKLKSTYPKPNRPP